MGVTWPEQGDFQGTPRFQIVRRIGQGGMGVVYEARDRDQGSRVALKTLLSMSGDHLVRFKNEFRSLQDLDHTNLVSLGELIEERGQWFFTMELVDGVSLLHYVWPHAVVPDEAAAAQSETTSGGSSDDDSEPELAPRDDEPTLVDSRGGHAEPSPQTPLWRRLDETRLRHALGQIALGLLALHRRGKVHRDIKPSNILVTPAERVVILDFGLVADVAGVAETDVVVGTPAYMAPEQARQETRVGPEADWYSLGVVLYRALTARLPFLGTAQEILHQKQSSPVIPPRVVNPEAPADLEELCLGLLKLSTRHRWTGRDVLRVLGLPEAPADDLEGASDAFVGRSREMRALDDAYQASRQGAVTVVVRGESGVGKSSLVAEWTRRHAQAGAVILSGRCYERESLPYKGVDGVVDALSRYLSRLPTAELEAILPARRDLLGRAFPALHSLAEAPAHADELDPAELRRLVFAAVRELFARLAARRPLVLAIDDLQWGDADSLALLSELLEPPGAPALLLMVTLRASAEAVRLPGEVRPLELGGLPPDEARTLAESLLQADAGTADRAGAIVMEAAGHPMFIAELARQRGPGQGPRRLDETLWTRIAALDPGARDLVTLVAVAGAPITQDLAARITGFDFAELPQMLSRLRSEHLLRTHGPGRFDDVETYHDRVREAVLARLDGAMRGALHRALARALEAQPDADPQVLYVHWREAGDRLRAADLAEKAAAQAAGALAFERAASLYRAALELDPERERLREALGEALANAGRGAEAARAFRSVAASAEGVRALDLARRAAEQLLRSGHLHEGLEALRGVLGELGLALPGTARQAVPSILWQRLLVRTRGLDFRARSADEIDAQTLARIDVCWSAAVGLTMVDPVRAAEFQSRMLVLALRAGEPYRISLALSLEAVNAAGGGANPRVDRIIVLARALAERVGMPHAIGMAHGAAGCAAYLEGRFARALESCDTAAPVFRTQCVGAVWESDTVAIVACWALAYMGQSAELQRRIPPAVREAEARGDRYAVAALRSGTLIAEPLARDDAEGARREADAAVRHLPSDQFLQQHWDDLLAQSEIDLYLGHGVSALERVRGRWRDLERAFVLLVQVSRVEAHFLRGRAALVAYAEGGCQDGALLAAARRDARKLAGQKAAWSQGLALLLEAGCANRAGDLERARAQLEEAARRFVTVYMSLHAAVCERRLGGLIGGSQGAALRAAADRYLAQQQVRRPDRVTAWLAPGFAD